MLTDCTTGPYSVWNVAYYIGKLGICQYPIFRFSHGSVPDDHFTDALHNRLAQQFALTSRIGVHTDGKGTDAGIDIHVSIDAADLILAGRERSPNIIHLVLNKALWCSRLARQPVTLEVDGSSPFGVAKKAHHPSG